MEREIQIYHKTMKKYSTSKPVETKYCKRSKPNSTQEVKEYQEKNNQTIMETLNLQLIRITIDT